MIRPKICLFVKRYGYKTLPLLIQHLAEHATELEPKVINEMAKLLEESLEEIAEGDACGCRSPYPPGEPDG